MQTVRSTRCCIQFCLLNLPVKVLAAADELAAAFRATPAALAATVTSRTPAATLPALRAALTVPVTLSTLAGLALP